MAWVSPPRQPGDVGLWFLSLGTTASERRPRLRLEKKRDSELRITLPAVRLVLRILQTLVLAE